MPRKPRLKRSATPNEKLTLLATLSILVFILIGSQSLLQIHPQNIIIDSDTTIESANTLVSFQDINANSTTLLVANQQYTATDSDIISIASDSYIQITAHQQAGTAEGIFVIPTRLAHIFLFEQEHTEIPASSTIYLSIGDDSIKITPLTSSTFNIKTGLSSYKISLSDGETTYLTDSNNNGMWKVTLHDDTFTISIVGSYTEQISIRYTE